MTIKSIPSGTNDYCFITQLIGRVNAYSDQARWVRGKEDSVPLRSMLQIAIDAQDPRVAHCVCYASFSKLAMVHL